MAWLTVPNRLRLCLRNRQGFSLRSESVALRIGRYDRHNSPYIEPTGTTIATSAEQSRICTSTLQEKTLRIWPGQCFSRAGISVVNTPPLLTEVHPTERIYLGKRLRKTFSMKLRNKTGITGTKGRR